jgi:plasmid stability protein
MVSLVVRTTVDIPDALYRKLKARAAAEGRSVKALLLDAATEALTTGAERSAHRVQVPLVGSKRPGRLKLDSARIYGAIGFP